MSSQNVGDAVELLADGNGEFTAAVGLEMDGSGFGLGTRSQRYAMVLEDGVVTQLFVEPGGGLTVSAADLASFFSETPLYFGLWRFDRFAVDLIDALRTTGAVREFTDEPVADAVVTASSTPPASPPAGATARGGGWSW